MDSIDEGPLESKSGVVSGVGVLDKAVLILAFLSTDGSATLSEVVEGTGLPRPTAYRLLSALEVHHLVARGEGRYSLGSRLLGWGNRVVAGAGLVEAARPVLATLRDATGESTQLYVREGSARVCVASVERATGLRDTVPVGAVLPLELGSGGKVLLAWAKDGKPPSEAEVGELNAIRSRGWAESVAEREAGVASVSAPVFDATRDVSESVSAVVSVSGPIARLGHSPGLRLAERVVAAAREIERALGPRPL